MNEGSDNIRLSEQLEALREMLVKNTQTTERVLWIISDPDTGLVKRVGDIGQVTSDTVKDQMVLTMQVQTLTANVELIQQRQVNALALQSKHDNSINDLLDCAEKAKEARKPWTQMVINGIGLILYGIVIAVLTLWLAPR